MLIQTQGKPWQAKWTHEITGYTEWGSIKLRWLLSLSPSCPPPQSYMGFFCSPVSLSSPSSVNRPPSPTYLHSILPQMVATGPSSLASHSQLSSFGDLVERQVDGWHPLHWDSQPMEPCGCIQGFWAKHFILQRELKIEDKMLFQGSSEWARIRLSHRAPAKGQELRAECQSYRQEGHWREERDNQQKPRVQSCVRRMTKCWVWSWVGTKGHY
jgi:hypothetical protein